MAIMAEQFERTPPGFECALGKADQVARAVKHRPGPGMTQARHEFCHWLYEHGGRGIIRKDYNILAQGDVYRVGGKHFLPKVEQAGLVTIQNNFVLITPAGQEYVAAYPLNTAGWQLIRQGRVEPHPPAE